MQQNFYCVFFSVIPYTALTVREMLEKDMKIVKGTQITVAMSSVTKDLGVSRFTLNSSLDMESIKCFLSLILKWFSFYGPVTAF